MPLEKSGDIAPERMKRLSQSGKDAQLIHLFILSCWDSHGPDLGPLSHPLNYGQFSPDSSFCLIPVDATMTSKYFKYVVMVKVHWFSFVDLRDSELSRMSRLLTSQGVHPKSILFHITSSHGHFTSVVLTFLLNILLKLTFSVLFLLYCIRVF